jgi:hypothetical protein
MYVGGGTKRGKRDETQFELSGRTKNHYPTFTIVSLSSSYTVPIINMSPLFPIIDGLSLWVTEPPIRKGLELANPLAPEQESQLPSKRSYEMFLRPRQQGQRALQSKRRIVPLHCINKCYNQIQNIITRGSLETTRKNPTRRLEFSQSARGCLAGLTFRVASK